LADKRTAIVFHVYADSLSTWMIGNTERRTNRSVRKKPERARIRSQEGERKALLLVASRGMANRAK
jgi:hypothetical protein